MQYNISFREKDKGWQYIISYKLDKKWKQKAKQGFKTKKEAKKASDLALSELKETIMRENKLNGNYSEITFYEFYELYAMDHKYTCTETTQQNMKYSVQAFKELYDYRLIDIKTEDIQRCINNLYESGRKQTTIVSRVGYLKMLFNSAVSYYKIIPSSPANNIKLKKSKNEITRNALTENDARELLKALKGSRYYLVALLGLTCGMRIGEILGLTKADIDFNNCNIDINKQFKLIDKDNNIWGLGELKSKNSYRVIPAPKETIRQIYLYTEMNEPAEDGRIFNFGNNKSFQTVMNNRIKDLGFNVCLHELRHTYATKLIANNVDFKTAAHLLGHTVSQTMNTYSHVTKDMVDNARNVIEEKF